MFLRINIFLAFFKTHSNRYASLRYGLSYTQAKMSSKSGQKQIYAWKHELHCYTNKI